MDFYVKKFYTEKVEYFNLEGDVCHTEYVQTEELIICEDLEDVHRTITSGFHVASQKGDYLMYEIVSPYCLVLYLSEYGRESRNSATKELLSILDSQGEAAAVDFAKTARW